jgi:hypothetical protein
MFMASLEPAQLERLVAYLKATDRDAPGLRNVITLAELTAESLKRFTPASTTKFTASLSASRATSARCARRSRLSA